MNVNSLDCSSRLIYELSLAKEKFKSSSSLPPDYALYDQVSNNQATLGKLLIALGALCTIQVKRGEHFIVKALITNSECNKLI